MYVFLVFFFLVFFVTFFCVIFSSVIYIFFYGLGLVSLRGIGLKIFDFYFGLVDML